LTGGLRFLEALGIFLPGELRGGIVRHLIHGGGDFCSVTGFHEAPYSPGQITAAFNRVTAADADELTVRLPGVFAGVLTFFWEFDFRPDQGKLIRDPFAGELNEDTVTALILKLTHLRFLAEMRVPTVVTRAGRKKPTCQLLDQMPLKEPPKPQP